MPSPLFFKLCLHHVTTRPVVGKSHDVGKLNAVDIQGGIDLGPVLAYAFAGSGRFQSEDGKTYGAGADMRVGANMLVGVKHMQGEFGATKLETTTLRFGWQF